MENISGPGHEGHVHDYRAAYERKRAEIDAVADDELIPINIDIPTFVMMVLGHLSLIMSLRSAILAALPNFIAAKLDELCDHVMAALYAHVEYGNLTTPPKPLQELGEQATTKRDLLHADALSAANRGLLPLERVLELKPEVGYRPTAMMILSLVNLFRANKSLLEGKTPVSEQELMDCESLALGLLNAVGVRDGALPTVGEAALTRQRAFTLAMKAYDHVRWGVSTARWEHQDADKYAPSPFSGRGGGNVRKTDAQPPVEAHPPAVPNTPITPAPSEHAGTPVEPRPAPAPGPSTNPFG